MHKKSILIAVNNLKIGGIQKALINLLKEIASKYDVTLYVFNYAGEYITDIPESVCVEKCKSMYKYFGMSQQESKQCFKDFFLRSTLAILTKFFGRNFTTKIISLFTKKIKKEYDVAISYMHDAKNKALYGGCNHFVLKKVNAKKKVTFLHCDYQRCGNNCKSNNALYEQFDYIAACSDGCRQVFEKCIPHLNDRILSVRNCNEYEKIRMLAGDGIDYGNDVLNIVTVARLSQEKGIERALEAVRVCVEQGYHVQYHIIGAGDREAFLKNKVKDCGLENIVLFHGNKTNPYPYIKGASLFLLTSYHEAAPMVFDEAACLGVPVLATQTTSTDEMIIQENAGFVCDNSQEAITQTLLEILAEPSSLETIARQLQEKQFSNEKAVEQFDKIINEE